MDSSDNSCQLPHYICNKKYKTLIIARNNDNKIWISETLFATLYHIVREAFEVIILVSENSPNFRLFKGDRQQTLMLHCIRK